MPRDAVPVPDDENEGKHNDEADEPEEVLFSVFGRKVFLSHGAIPSGGNGPHYCTKSRLRQRLVSFFVLSRHGVYN